MLALDLAHAYRVFISGGHEDVLRYLPTAGEAMAARWGGTAMTRHDRPSGTVPGAGWAMANPLHAQSDRHE